jgi:putative hydrolase of the HAD superfamily
MHVEAVLFDVGETLLWLDEEAIAVSVGVPAPAVAEALLGMRRGVDAALAPALVSGRLADAASLAADPAGMLVEALGLAPEARPVAVQRLHTLDREGRLWCVVPPDAHQALERLRALGYRLAGVSNSDGSAEAKLQAAGLADHLEWVLDSALEGVAKPDPALFLRAVTRLDLPPERCLYVGDLYASDVLAARAAGLEAVLFDRSGRYDNPCTRVTSLSELVEALTPGSPTG